MLRIYFNINTIYECKYHSKVIFFYNITNIMFYVFYIVIKHWFYTFMQALTKQKNDCHIERQSFYSNVRQRRFELPSPFRRYHLKVVRLPVSPSPHTICCKYSLLKIKKQLLHKYYRKSSPLTNSRLLYKNFALMVFFNNAFT